MAGFQKRALPPIVQSRYISFKVSQPHVCFAGAVHISEAFSRWFVYASCLKVLDRYVVVGYEENMDKRLLLPG